MDLKTLLPAIAMACTYSSQPEQPKNLETRLVISVTDKGIPVPARVMLYEGSSPINFGSLDSEDKYQGNGYCELQDGVIASWHGLLLADGQAELPIAADICNVYLRHGNYRVEASRGIEYEIASEYVELLPESGEVLVQLELDRAFSRDAVPGDFHIHSDASPDSSTPKRTMVISEAAAGVNILASTDHYISGDFDFEIESLGFSDRMISIPGCEFTFDKGHFNLFPYEETAENIMALHSNVSDNYIGFLRGIPGNHLIQINHPKLGGVAYLSKLESEGKTDDSFFEADTFEVLSGYAGGELTRMTLADYYMLYDRGIFLAAMGNSDSHHMNDILAGLPRTYVFTPFFDSYSVVDAIRSRRTMATSGPYLKVSVNGAGPGETACAEGRAVSLEIKLDQASFSKADTLRVIGNGKAVREFRFEGDFYWQGLIPIDKDETWIGVDAYGDEPLPEFLSGEAHHWVGGLKPFAVISPILLRQCK